MAWLDALDAGAQVAFRRVLIPSAGEDGATADVLADIAGLVLNLSPEDQTMVHEFLLLGAWMVDHHPEPMPLPDLLEGLREVLTAGQLFSVEMMRHGMRNRAETHITNTLQQVLKGHFATPHQQLTHHSRVFSSLLIDNAGRFDTAARFVFRSLVDRQGPLGILPPIRTHEHLVRLEQLLAPDGGLPALIDELSAIEPVHEGPARLMQIECATPTLDRCQRAQCILAALMCFPRQEDGMGICWLMAPNIQIHLNRPERLLQHMAHWFEHGHISTEGVSGLDHALVPTLHPVHALQELKRPIGAEPEAQRAAVRRLVDTIHHTCGGETDDAIAEVVLAWEQLAVRRRAITLRALLERVLLQRTGLRSAVLHRPRSTLSPQRLEDVRRYEQRLEDCIATLEASHTSLLMFAWANTIGGDVMRGKLVDCWGRIQSLMGLDSGSRSRTPERIEHMGAVKELFLSCATFRYKDNGASDNTLGTELELCLRLPQTTGGGTRVQNLQALQQWLMHLSAHLCARDGESDAAVHEWWVGVLKGPRFQRTPAHALADILVARSGTFLRADLESAEYSRKPVVTLNPRVAALDRLPLQVELSSVTVEWGLLPLPAMRLSDEASLKHLLRMLRDLHRLHPDALRETLQANHGRLHLLFAGLRGERSLHNMNLLPEHPPLLNAWTDEAGVSTGTWIRTTLVDPARARLRGVVGEGEAAALLRSVLQACRLQPPVSPEALATELLASVRRVGGQAQPGIRLRDLVSVLRRAGERRSDKCFDARDPLKNGLSLAVLRQPRFFGPCLVYADPNWAGSDRLFFCHDPIRKAIGHFAGHQVTWSKDESGVVPVSAIGCFFF